MKNENITTMNVSLTGKLKDHVHERVADGTYSSASDYIRDLIRADMAKPVSVVDQAEADRQLSDLLSRVKYTGAEPMPSEDKLVEEVAGIIHDMRRDNAEGSAR